MTNSSERPCVECDALDRRDFVRLAGLGTVAVASTALVPGSLRAESEVGPTPRVRKAGPAEDLIKELFADMSDRQKTLVCRSWDNKDRRTVNPNKALDRTIGDVFNKGQMELIERIVKAICSDDKGFHQISRAGTWDASKSFENTGVNIFGEPGNGKFAFLFTGHHLTIRCDGDSEDGAAFGGPIYYGHTPNGYSDRNVFSYQTQEVIRAFEALNKEQQKAALVTKGNPGEGEKSIRFRKKDERKPGLAYKELSKDQQELFEKVMRSILSPFRKEDADEVMRIIKETGGMEKMHFAFYTEEYEDVKTNVRQPWSFWRVEGPGFVWNYRVLPHVHTYVNISSKIG